MPLTDAALALLSSRVSELQDALGRPVLLENVSTYVRFRDDQYGETAFLAELASRTGCGVLLDVNNLYVNQCNHGEDAIAAMNALAIGTIGEIHLAGHRVTDIAVIDDHGSRVANEVWALYEYALQQFGTIPALIEWDTDIPALSVVLDEAGRARDIQATVHARRSALPPSTQHGASDALRRLSHCSACLPDRWRANSDRCLRGCNARRAKPITRKLAATTRQVPLDKRPLNGNGNGSGSVSNGDELADNLRQRVDLYRSSIRANRRTALASAYPVLQDLVGEAYFDALSVAYAQAYPSQSGDLNRFGAALPAFIETYEQGPRFRYFCDLARLEWSLHLAYFAADANVLTQAEWTAIRPEDLLDAKLAVHPACALVSSRYAIAEIWTAHQTGRLFTGRYQVTDLCTGRATTLAPALTRSMHRRACDFRRAATRRDAQ